MVGVCVCVGRGEGGVGRGEGVTPLRVLLQLV